MFYQFLTLCFYNLSSYQIGLSEHYAAIAQSEWPFFNKGAYIRTAAIDLKKEDLLAFYDNYIIGGY